MKSLSGYLVAFVVAIVVWMVLSKVIQKFVKGEPAVYWTVIQWITSGSLWAVWIMQDAANIAVYLPRSLSLGSSWLSPSTSFSGWAFSSTLRGDKIQKVVTEKSDVRDIRSATIIDFVYAVIL
ncbi:MAG: hypothetical protein U5K31_05260 [Balneolaceae bacterium]|nr:hypothetical protein [Balneolaceae bacterium]